MTLARTMPDDANGWWALLAVLALYAVTRWFLAWNQARREGDPSPLRAAFDEEEPDEGGTATATAFGGFRSYRQYFAFAGGALVIGLVLGLTEGRTELVMMCTVVPAVVIAVAYLDFRRARSDRARARA
ncbi:hypothetical protein ACIP88_14105 [Streptomyces uncialis]|uniref:hypothetical protein n=1 Tax=Streptomyces uncialis TaxID=1048205 RepID=UPI00381F1B40